MPEYAVACVLCPETLRHVDDVALDFGVATNGQRHNLGVCLPCAVTMTPVGQRPVYANWTWPRARNGMSAEDDVPHGYPASDDDSPPVYV